jgi:hypothetical protein
MAALTALTVIAFPRRAATAAPEPADAPDLYAIVVGHNGGAPGLPPLRFADDDAIRFWFLLSGLSGRPERARVTLLTRVDGDTRADLQRAGLRPRPDGPPSRDGVLGALESVKRALAARPAGTRPPVFYFVYAGHGLAGRILLDSDAGGGEAALTGHELRAAVAGLTQVAPDLRAYVFLDACRSQSLFTERGPARDDALGPDLAGEAAALEAKAGAAPIGVLTAAFSGRPAGEVRALGAGYFSHVLASGMAGAADADGDERVSFAELAAFVAYNTERLTAQRPWFSPPGGDMEAPVVDLRRGAGRMELSEAPPGRYLIQAATGKPIFVEAVKAARGALRLTLPAGRYRVVRAAPEELGRSATADVDLTANVPLNLATSAWNDTQPAARGEPSGGDPADAPAFGSAFTSEAVSTLTAAYHAGREPAMAATERSGDGHANSVGLAIGAGTAPVGLPGVEPGVALRFRRQWGRLSPAWSFFAGGRLSHGQSSHTAGVPYRLERTTVFLEGGGRWQPTARLEATVGLNLGGGPLVRRQTGAALSGDPFVPTVAAEVGAALRLHGRWSLLIDVRATAQWVRIDGARAGSAGLAAETGLGWSF